MNTDFHYYVTFIAARAAGFDQAAAKTIAYAAQYVDASEKDMIVADLLPAINPTPTFETNSQLAKKNILTNESELIETKEIWSAFHFLPGNSRRVENLSDRISYEGKKSTLAYSYKDSDEADFDYLCLTNSTLSERMVNTIATHRHQPYFLHLIGIGMHVLADSWAHHFFAGLPSYWINDVSDEVFWSRKEKVKFTSAKLISGLEISRPFICTPEGFTCDSYCQLGHGRIGHLPDLPYAQYTYKPRWSSITLDKDNPSDFLMAFLQITYAMKCIHEDIAYEKNTYFLATNKRMSDLINEVSTTFKNLAYSEALAGEIWFQIIKKYFPVIGETFEKFNDKAWLNAAKVAHIKTVTNYYYFNIAARLFRDYVRAQMTEN